MGFPKRLLGTDETLVLVLRPHIKQLFVSVVVLLVVTPATSFLTAAVPVGAAQPWLRGAVLLAGGLVLARWAIWPFVVWWNTIYAVTDRRLVIRRGVFTRSGHDMPLTRLNDISFSHSVIERLLGCGTLVVESAGERGQLELADVPRVEQVQRTLYRLSDEARTNLAEQAPRPSGSDEPEQGDWR